MPAADLAIAAPILAAAGWLLWRSFRRGKPCGGCSGGGRCEKRPSAPPSALVKLGRH